MKNKIVFIVIIALALTILVSYTMLFDGNPFLQDLKMANDEYKIAKSVDYDAQKAEYEQLLSQIQVIESEIMELEASLKNAEAERAQKIIELRQQKLAELASKEEALRDKIDDIENLIRLEMANRPVDPVYATSTSDMIFAMTLDGINHTSSDVVSFIGENSKDGNYTIKFVGYADALVEILDNVTNNLRRYNISIGHCSFRQVYQCYNNMRPWDQATLLDWFNKQYVNGSGGLGTIEGGYVIDGLTPSGVMGGNPVLTLTEQKDKDLADSQAIFDEKVAEIEAERIAALLEAYRSVEGGKVDDLVESLNLYYNKMIENEETAKMVRDRNIIKTYNDRLDALDIEPPVDIDGDGEVDVIIDDSIADPDLLLYTLDITFNVYTGK